MKKRRLLIIGLWLMAVMAAVAQTIGPDTSCSPSGNLLSKNFTTRDGLASNVVNTAIQDHQGYIWLGTNHGLTRFDGHRFVNFYVEKNGKRQIEGIGNIVEDTSRRVLLMNGMDYKLLCFDLEKMQFVSADDMKLPDTIDNAKDEQMIQDRAKTLGIERGNHINRRHDLHYLRLDDGRELFATIDNGFFIYDPSTTQLQHYGANDEKPVIESDYINGILKDRSGSVWLATTFAGIYQLQLDGEGLIAHELPATNVRSLCALNTDEIVVSDMDGHLFSHHLEAHQSQLLYHLPHRVYTANMDKDGRLWLGTRGGGVMIDGKATDIPARQIYDIVFDGKGTAWIATLDAGLLEVNTTDLTAKTYLQGERAHEVDVDDKGRLWIATEHGVFRKDGENIKTIYNEGKVVCICHSADGTVWAGSNGNGLLKIVGDKVTLIQADNGLANNCVESVACDDQGNVIAGTDQGVSVVNILDGTVKNVYSSDGLRADTYNENAILKLSDGRIFLGNLKGLVELRTTHQTNSSAGRPLMAPCITAIDVNNVPRYDHLTGKIELSYDQNNLCFFFSSFAYKDLSSVVYSYKLEGVDHDWHPSTKESRALYTNLTPGHYRFHVRSSLAGSEWGKETVLDVYIAQPWYWTWWARVLYILIIVLFVLYELHQYQQRLSLRRQLDQRLAALYAVEVQQKQSVAPAETSKEPVAKDADDEAKASVTTQKDKDFLYKLDHLILENLLQTDLDVNFIAQEMCMSYSTLHRRMKSIAGMTINEYVRKHRLAKAMKLLSDGHNATEVSIQCGFNSLSYFTRCFKAEYGMTPSEVQK